MEHNQGKEKLVSLSRGRVNLTVLMKENTSNPENG
jgi:hypothetical protein